MSCIDISISARSVIAAINEGTKHGCKNKKNTISNFTFELR